MVASERRPTLVFVPGFMQRGAAWSAVADRARTRYPSVLVDHRSFTFDGRLREIAEAADPPAALVGYSLGGRLALRAALDSPHRFSALVLVGTSAGIDDPAERARRRADDDALAAWMERRSIEEVVERWETRPIFATQQREHVAAQRPGRLAHDPADLAALLRSAGQGALEPVWDRLERLELPVLCLAGERDRSYGALAERMAAALPRGEWRLVPGAGHAPQLEAPEAFSALLVEFLDEHLR